RLTRTYLMNRSASGGALVKVLLLLLCLAALAAFFTWKSNYGKFGSVTLMGSTAGKIAFVRQDDNNRTQLCIVKADGAADPQPLTDDRGAKQAPAWSPDGARICYVAEPDKGGAVEHTFQLFLLGAGQPQQMTV